MKLSKTALLKKKQSLSGFADVEDLFYDFEYDGCSRYGGKELKVPKHLSILYADYTYEDYNGDAYVLGYNKETNKFFEVHGSHCSCYGLEDQWDEEYFDDVKQMQFALEKRFESEDSSSWYYRSADSSKEFREWLES